MNLRLPYLYFDCDLNEGRRRLRRVLTRQGALLTNFSIKKYKGEQHPRVIISGPDEEVVKFLLAYCKLSITDALQVLVENDYDATDKDTIDLVQQCAVDLAVNRGLKWLRKYGIEDYEKAIAQVGDHEVKRLKFRLHEPLVVMQGRLGTSGFMTAAQMADLVSTGLGNRADNNTMHLPGTPITVRLFEVKGNGCDIEMFNWNS